MTEHIRKAGLAARRSLREEQRRVFSRRIVQRIEEMPEYKQAENVLIYYPLKSEVDLRSLAGAKKLCYPVTNEAYEITAVRPALPESWHQSSMGIMEPVFAEDMIIKPEELDLVICPCSAFDGACKRTGMGKGCYDRYLPRCTKAFVAAVAFECQRVGAIPEKAWDYPMDAVITEAGTYFRI